MNDPCLWQHYILQKLLGISMVEVVHNRRGALIIVLLEVERDKLFFCSLPGLPCVLSATTVSNFGEKSGVA